MRKMIQLIIIDTGTMYGINSFIDAVARAIGKNRFENIYNERQTLFQKLGKKWLLIHYWIVKARNL